MEYYFVMRVKLATGAFRYLVVYIGAGNNLCVRHRFDDELEALAMVEYLERTDT